MRIEDLRKIRVELTKVKPNKMEDGEMENTCWEGYEPIGTKELDGKTVPNCVPIKEEQSKQKFVIPSPDAGEDEQTYISRCISSIVDEYGPEQASGICYSQWEKK
jgi:hypothetical protein